MKKLRWVIVAVVLSMLLGACDLGVFTRGGDSLRSGWYSEQPTLSPDSVGSSSFGQLFATQLAGQVYAQPLVWHNIVLTVTETNDIYGIDATTGAILWHRNLGLPWNSLDLNCNDLGQVGVTGTPVLDPDTGIAYFVSKTYASGSTGPAAQFFHAIDVTTGTEETGWPVPIVGTASNNGNITFDPTLQLDRPGLVLTNGVVYAAWAGHCDRQPFTGWVMGFSTATPTITTMWNTEAGAGERGEGGIWQSGGGIASDGTGQLIVVTGNGVPPADGPGRATPMPTNFGQAVVRLAAQEDGSLAPVDFFSPANADQLNTYDGDLGSGGPALLPDSFGTSAHPHLMSVVGKEGYVYLLDRDDLGGRGQGPGGTDDVVARVGPDGGTWGKPAVWPGDGGWMYVVTAAPGPSSGGSAGVLHAYRRTLDAEGNVSLSLSGASSDEFGFSAGSPVVTSDGTQDGSALVWVIWAPPSGGTASQLRAYDAIPRDGVMHLRWSAPLYYWSKFSVPAITGGRIYVGTRGRQLVAFGQINGGLALSGDPLTFPPTNVGDSSTLTATLTASRPVTVNALATSDPEFTLGTPAPALPASLSDSDTLTVPVTFTPTAGGSVPADLDVATDVGSITLSLTGVARSPTYPLSAAPLSVDFGTYAQHGATVTRVVTISNIGYDEESVTASVPPVSPFGVTGLPSPGYFLQPGANFGVTVSFTPPGSNGLYTSSMSVSIEGQMLTVPIRAVVGTPAHLTLSPPGIAFGGIDVGEVGTASFTVSNTGGVAMQITKSKPPTVGGFSALTSLPEGTVLQAGASATETVQFAPAAGGSAGASWDITADDGSGPQSIALSGYGELSPSAPGPLQSGWQLNGSASMDGAALQLTPNALNLAGSAFWPTPVGSNILLASFDAQIGGGAGADGLTFALEDPISPATALGADGEGLGWVGIPGVAVTLDTHQDAGDPASNFIGVATGSSDGLPVYSAVATNIPDLRSGSHRIGVLVYGGTIFVMIDGTLVITTPVTLPPSVRVGFTGSTSAIGDRHAVSNVTFATFPPS